MWQWLVGVTMATGGFVAIRKEEEGADDIMCSPALLYYFDLVFTSHITNCFELNT